LIGDDALQALVLVLEQADALQFLTLEAAV